ncbi:hypothetical protein V8F33_008277 [Rhypophila sp. PSN 637]
MASSLATQLAEIAANSRSTLNTKALKAAHSKSLIFEPRIAASQTFAEIYSLCRDGFEELCHLDPRFAYFNNSLWSEQSQEQDRTQMSKDENAALDKHIDAFLHLCGSRLRLMPAIKAVEWLIRRFRIHEFNTAILITTFLPYHTIPVFMTLLSILPSQLPVEYRFLNPYIKSLTALPRAAIVTQATNRPSFLSGLSQYTLESCRTKQEYPALISFWAGITAEAVNGMLDKGRSGRRAIQTQNNLALLQEIGPILSDAMVMKDVPGLRIASYMIVTILASKGNLGDAALSSFMDQLVLGWTADTHKTGLVCLCILSQFRSAKQLSARVTKALLKVHEIAATLSEINKDYRADRLANGLALALVDRLSKKGDIRGLPVVKSLLVSELLQKKQIKVLCGMLLVAPFRVNDEVDPDGQIRKELGSWLVSLSQADGNAGDSIRAAIKDAGVDIDELELKLGTSIRPTLAIEDAPDAMDEDSMPVVAEERTISVDFEKLSLLPEPPSSCLAQGSSSLLNDLSEFFISVAGNEENLKQFDEAPILSRPLAPTKSFYLSFYMRLWCGPVPTLAKVAALERVKLRLKEDDCADYDFHAIIPYCITALSDPSKKVRRAAGDLVTVIGQSFTKSSHPGQTWGTKDLYGKPDEFHWLSPEDVRKFIHSVLLPSLEESVLHEDHVLTALTSALEGETEKKISSSVRLSIFKFLSSTVIATPLLLTKLRLLKSLNSVRKISGTSRTDLLLPLLRWWASLAESDAQLVAAQQSVDEAALDKACVDVVIANNQAGHRLLVGLAKDAKTATRPGLIRAIFSRIAKIWPSMKSEPQLSTAQEMLLLAQTPLSPVSVEAAELLRGVDLSTKILAELLESLENELKMPTAPSPYAKRRRLSAPEEKPALNLQPSAEAKATVNKATFILELVQSSNPAQHPELLPNLFEVLSGLIHLRSLVGSELGYLQDLVLSSLSAMIPAYKNNKNLSIDASVGYGDVLALCIQRSSSPHVINAALLLVASLATTAPEVVLHSVMPIFTFMSSSVLKQADDYSAIVVHKTIKEVIPPLIETFRKNKRNLVASTADLLTSFVTAFEHIPAHRKHELFMSLIEKLGPDDFLFAVIGMLVDRYGPTDNITEFTTQIMASLSVETQLQTLIKSLDLTNDILKPKPTISNTLLGKHDKADQDPQKIALKQLTLLPNLLANRRLKQEIVKLTENDDMESAKVLELYAQLLEHLLTLGSAVKAKKALYSRVGDALANLLNLLSISSFIKIVETLLERKDVALRQKVLRALELRVDKESNTDPKSRAALLAFLPQLTAVIRESNDMGYKHTAVTCVDKIAEKYGKKDLETVAAAAATIAGDHCLGQPTQSLRVMALLCLASLVDVLQDAIVPVLPAAIPKALGYLEEMVAGGSPDLALHNAVYTFMTALAQHIPYMISGAYLDRLLTCSSASAAAGLDSEANQNRVDCLKFLATLVDSKVLFTALNNNWSKAVGYGYPALAENLRILGVALDKHTKSTVSKNATILAEILLNGLDVRRVVASADYKGPQQDETQLEALESAVNENALKMIYKLNDASFRPLFNQMIEWSVSGLPIQDKKGRTLRMLSLYGFLHTFFDNLKSIVTGYASYITDNAVKIVREANLKDDNERELWSRVLETLGSCFEFDKDDFWQAPTHFGTVMPLLVDQFLHAGKEGFAAEVTESLIPAVVELATVADSTEHHKDLNTRLLKLMRSEEAGVRLAVVKCQQELTDRLGAEWLRNLVEMVIAIRELQDDDDEIVERENQRWIVAIEKTLGESLDTMLQ